MKIEQLIAEKDFLALFKSGAIFVLPGEQMFLTDFYEQIQQFFSSQN